MVTGPAQVLRDKQADLIAISPEILNNPNWPVDAARGFGTGPRRGKTGSMRPKGLLTGRNGPGRSALIRPKSQCELPIPGWVADLLHNIAGPSAKGRG